MGKEHLVEKGLKKSHSGALGKDDDGQAVALDIGRVNVFVGWIVAMVGIVLYCVALFGEDPSEPFGSILDHGWVGGTALALMATGVLQWIYGAVFFLRELERGSGDDQP